MNKDLVSGIGRYEGLCNADRSEMDKIAKGNKETARRVHFETKKTVEGDEVAARRGSAGMQ